MENQLRTIKIIHFALIAGLVLAYFIIGDILNITIPTLEGENLFYIFIPAIAVLASNFVFKNLLSKIDSKQSKEQKLMQYQTASIVRWAILEGGAFLILFLKPELAIFGLLLILYLFLVKPTKEKIENELNIKL
ncbi:MFS transporter [Tenacibaculum aquimarinum]|uniref:MFS transporter n=1 Tax=Tenacibaculum aquimarinum TaxID=2910675 RepID=UPI001F0B0111|nr:MFS transporter [Tenacibaculum aquimarinum]MCH3885886.1 MFS transporter [Tenacibaculum aquimarinum]